MENKRKERIMNFRIVTEDELREQEKEIDTHWLKNIISIKGKIIKTFGDLRPYIKSSKIAAKFEDFLEEDEYSYFAQWILRKEIKEKMGKK